MTSGALNPLQFPQAWDVVNIGGILSPGLAEVSEFKRAYKFDEKVGKGVQGSTITYTGRPAAKGTIKFKLWLASQFDDWEDFRPLFKYDPTKTAVEGVDIFHPALADLDIGSVVCEDIGSIVHEGEQLYSITVSLLEYSPPPAIAAVSTPTTTTGDAGAANAKAPELTPAQQLDAVNQQIAAAQAATP